MKGIQVGGKLTKGFSDSGRALVANEFLDSVLILSDGDFWFGKGIGLKGETQGEIASMSQ